MHNPMKFSLIHTKPRRHVLRALCFATALLLLAVGARAQYITGAVTNHNDAIVNKLVPNAGLTQLLYINTLAVKRIMVMCSVTGQALSAFQISVVPDNNVANPVAIASAAGDYSSPVAPLIRVIGAPVTLAAGATAMFIMDTGGIDNVIVYATSGNAAGSTVSCYSSGS